MVRTHRTIPTRRARGRTRRHAALSLPLSALPPPPHPPGPRVPPIALLPRARPPACPPARPGRTRSGADAQGGRGARAGGEEEVTKSRRQLATPDDQVRAVKGGGTAKEPCGRAARWRRRSCGGGVAVTTSAKRGKGGHPGGLVGMGEVGAAERATAAARGGGGAASGATAGRGARRVGGRVEGGRRAGVERWARRRRRGWQWPPVG